MIAGLIVNSASEVLEPAFETLDASLDAGENAAQYWANRSAESGNWLYDVPGAFASLWTHDTALSTTLTLAPIGWGARGYRLGREISQGRNFRVAPFGNRTGHRTGRYPHYHRRGMNRSTGDVHSGQGIGRHRPWDAKSTDRSFWDRF